MKEGRNQGHDEGREERREGVKLAIGKHNEVETLVQPPVAPGWEYTMLKLKLKEVEAEY